MIGLGDGIDTLDRRQRKLDDKIVGGGAAAPHHLDRGERCAEILVFGAAAAVHRHARAQKHFEGNAVADQTLAKPAMSVGVTVHEPRHEQPVGGVDYFRVSRGRHVRRADHLDGAVLDQHVGEVGTPGLDVQDPTVANDNAFHHTA